MLVQHGNQVLIAVADEPAGPFKWHQKISMLDRIGTPNTGDQIVFTDEDTGKSYLIYFYGKGRNKIYVSEIGVKDGKIDLLTVPGFTKVLVVKGTVCSSTKANITWLLQICTAGTLRWHII